MAWMTGLVAARDEHFAWLLDERGPCDSLVSAPGGIEDPAVLKWLRTNAPIVRSDQSAGTWLIVDDGEVVGLCSYKARNADGVVEIGYGIAPSRRQRGHATRAVTLLLEASRQDPAIKALAAETATNNLPSQRVLERNGFARTGERFDDSDGWLALWRSDIR